MLILHINNDGFLKYSIYIIKVFLELERIVVHCRQIFWRFIRISF